jgi:hypothetical protein
MVTILPYGMTMVRWRDRIFGKVTADTGGYIDYFQINRLGKTQNRIKKEIEISVCGAAYFVVSRLNT